MSSLSSPKEDHDKVLRLLQEHQWFSESIPLIASENIPNPAVWKALNAVSESAPERVRVGESLTTSGGTSKRADETTFETANDLAAAVGEL